MFTIKKKPVKPLRRSYKKKYKFGLGFGKPIKDVIEELSPILDVDSGATLVILQGDFSPTAIYYTKESIENYNIRLAQYEQKLAAYNSWYEENKEKIEEELTRREERKKEKERTRNTIMEMREEIQRLEHSLD